MPVSNLDSEAILHPLFSMSSRKYFNYHLTLQQFSGGTVEIPVEKTVDKMWKTPELLL